MNSSSIVHRVPREDPVKKKAMAQGLGGRYKVVHGRMVMGATADDIAYEGDTVELSDVDAALALEHGVIERDEPAKASPAKMSAKPGIASAKRR